MHLYKRITREEEAYEMAERIYSKDLVLVLAASFFAMGSCMMVVPLIAGFSEDVGAAAAVMGVIVGIMNIVSLLCDPLWAT